MMTMSLTQLHEARGWPLDWWWELGGVGRQEAACIHQAVWHTKGLDRKPGGCKGGAAHHDAPISHTAWGPSLSPTAELPNEGIGLHLW